MDLRAVRRRCESTLRDVSVPSPFDVRAFTATVSSRRGRPIHLLPKSAPLGPCGVWLAMPSADYVFFENATSPLHREHISASSTNGGKFRTPELSAPPRRIKAGPSPPRSNAIVVPAFDRTVLKVCTSRAMTPTYRRTLHRR
jgi:hypothetical protein